MDELDDFDVFDYWDDLQYGDDSYWDYGGIRAQAGLKRKRIASSPITNNDKRRKLSLLETGGDNVRFVNWTARKEMATRTRPIVHRRASFALFGDWKQRFANDDGVILNKEMPAAMRRAAEGGHEDSPRKESNFSPSFASAEEEGPVDVEAEQTADDMQAELASLDPEMLKSILRQKLGDAGLEGMDENALMHMIHKMLSGEEGADDAADDLTNSVLERATQGNDVALSGWLSQQGVSLDAAGADEDETDSVATPELPEEVDGRKQIQNIKSSPSDSAIEMQKAIGGASTELAIRPPSPTELAKKRTAPSTDEDGPEAKKRKKVSFDVPPVPESTAVSQENGLTKAQEENAERLETPTTEDPLMSEAMIDDDDNIRVAKTRAANAIAVNNNETNTADVAQSEAVSINGPSQAETETNTNAGEEDDEIVVAPAPAKNTRKRKAEAEKAAPKKQARKASGPTDAAGKRTRNTRATTKVGK